MQQLSRKSCRAGHIKTVVDFGRRFELCSDSTQLWIFLLCIARIFEVFDFNTYCAKNFLILSVSILQDSTNRQRAEAI